MCGSNLVGRWGYNNKGDCIWLDPAKFDRKLPSNVHFQTLLHQIEKRSKKDAEELIITYYERELINDGDFDSAIKHLPV